MKYKCPCGEIINTEVDTTVTIEESLMNAMNKIFDHMGHGIPEKIEE